MSASQPDADAQPDPRHTGRSIPDVFREAVDHDYSALESSARVGDEFNQITDRFAFGEMWPASELDDRRKILVSVACVAASGGDELSALLRAGLHLGVAAKELQEVFHQIAPYVGISRTRHGLQELDKLVRSHRHPIDSDRGRSPGQRNCRPESNVWRRNRCNA